MLNGKQTLKHKDVTPSTDHSTPNTSQPFEVSQEVVHGPGGRRGEECRAKWENVSHSNPFREGFQMT